VTRPEGHTDPAFTRVAEVFAAHLAAGDRGALAVRIDGRTVVDLRGGRVDPAFPAMWQEDTLACVFSVTKGVLSLLAHVMIDRGEIALDDPVARWWPEFAASGKSEITLRNVMTHSAGLPAVSVPVQRGDLYDWKRMVGALATSAPVTPVGALVYHNMTYGHLLGEILCRASGIRPLFRLLAERVTGPLGADFRLGLDAAALLRTARIAGADPAGLFAALQADPESLFARSMAFFGEGEDFNSPDWRTAEIGSGSGHATAMAIARLYEALIQPGLLLSDQRRADLARLQIENRNPDPILGVPLRFAQGVELSAPPGIDFGPSPRSLGHWGAGGATGLADPDTGVAFGYVTADMATGLGSSPRCRALIASVLECLQGR